MKKRLISLVAAAALVGGVAVAGAPQVAKAGTVTVKGDTQATLYGFVWAEYNWANKIEPGLFGETGADYANMPMPEDAKNYTTAKKTNASADSWVTRIGFAFKNEDAGLTGRIEGGFFHGTNFRLRRGYVQHNFDNFYVLVGQEWILEENFASISAGFTPPVGWDEGILRVPQVKIGTKMDLGSANLDFAIAFEWGNKAAVSSSKANNALEVNRYTVPTTAARAILHFDTGFGAPAKFYAWGAMIPVYVSNKAYVKAGAVYSLDNTTGKIEPDAAHKVAAGSLVSDKSETSYAFGLGIKVPVSMVTIGANYEYSDGATNYAGATSYQPASYYVDNKGGVQDTEMYAYNVNLTVAPMPCVAVGAEYDYAEFKNNDIFTNGDKPDVKTIVGNVKVKTTKHTTLVLEWRHFKAEDFNALPTGTADDSFSGNQVFVRYMYVF